MSAAGVRRRLSQGLGALLYGQGVAIVVQLAGVPILLHAWGTRLYGEWLILFAIPSYLSMADLGFSQSAANDMTARHARGDTAGELAVFQSLAILVYSTLCIGLLLVAAVLWSLPLHQWFPVPDLSANALRWILAMLSAEVLTKLADGVNHAGFRSHGEYGLHVALSYTTLLTQFVMVWAVALAGGGLVAASVAFVLVRALATPGVAIFLRYRHRDLRFGVANASHRILGTLIKPAFANVSTPLALALSTQGVILVVGSLAGPVSVVTFATLRTLTRLVSQTAWKISHAFEPELAAAWGAQNDSLLRSLYQHAQRLGMWFALVASGALLIGGGWILRIWTHGKVSMDSTLFHWLLMSALASVAWYGALNLLKAANVHLHAALWYVVSAGVGLALAALSLWMTGRLSSVGVALGVVDALMVVVLWRMVSRTLDVRSQDLLRAMLDPRPVLRAILERRSSHAAR